MYYEFMIYYKKLAIQIVFPLVICFYVHDKSPTAVVRVISFKNIFNSKDHYNIIYKKY